MFKQITEGLCCQKEGQYTLTYSIPKNGGNYDAVSGHVESLSQSVIENLTLHRVNKICF